MLLLLKAGKAGKSLFPAPSKSEHPLQKYDVISISQDGGHNR